MLTKGNDLLAEHWHLPAENAHQIVVTMICRNNDFYKGCQSAPVQQTPETMIFTKAVKALLFTVYSRQETGDNGV
jgi:hypothetical protein